VSCKIILFTIGKEIHAGLAYEMGYATVKRILSHLLSSNLVYQQGKVSKYFISQAFDLFYSVDTSKPNRRHNNDQFTNRTNKSLRYFLIFDNICHVNI